MKNKFGAEIRMNIDELTGELKKMKPRANIRTILNSTQYFFDSSITAPRNPIAFSNSLQTAGTVSSLLQSLKSINSVDEALIYLNVPGTKPQTFFIDSLQMGRTYVEIQLAE